jgi:hypothetical protein
MFTYFNGYLFSKMCIHFNFENKKKCTKTGSKQICVQFLLTKVAVGVQQRIGNFDKSRRRIQVSFQKELLAALKRRFNEKHNKDMMTLMAYLQAGKR